MGPFIVKLRNSYTSVQKWNNLNILKERRRQNPRVPIYTELQLYNFVAWQLSSYVSKPTMCLSSHSCVRISTTLFLLSIAYSPHIEAEHNKSLRSIALYTKLHLSARVFTWPLTILGNSRQ